MNEEPIRVRPDQITIGDAGQIILNVPRAIYLKIKEGIRLKREERAKFKEERKQRVELRKQKRRDKRKNSKFRQMLAEIINSNPEAAAAVAEKHEQADNRPEHKGFFARLKDRFSHKKKKPESEAPNMDTPKPEGPQASTDPRPDAPKPGQPKNPNAQGWPNGRVPDNQTDVPDMRQNPADLCTPVFKYQEDFEDPNIIRTIDPNAKYIIVQSITRDELNAITDSLYKLRTSSDQWDINDAMGIINSTLNFYNRLSLPNPYIEIYKDRLGKSVTSRIANPPRGVNYLVWEIKGENLQRLLNPELTVFEKPRKYGEPWDFKPYNEEERRKDEEFVTMITQSTIGEITKNPEGKFILRNLNSITPQVTKAPRRRLHLEPDPELRIDPSSPSATEESMAEESVLEHHRLTKEQEMAEYHKIYQKYMDGKATEEDFRALAYLTGVLGGSKKKPQPEEPKDLQPIAIQPRKPEPIVPTPPQGWPNGRVPDESEAPKEDNPQPVLPAIPVEPPKPQTEQPKPQDSQPTKSTKPEKIHKCGIRLVRLTPLSMQIAIIPRVKNKKNKNNQENLDQEGPKL